jgi:hypothetical protein
VSAGARWAPLTAVLAVFVVVTAGSAAAAAPGPQRPPTRPGPTPTVTRTPTPTPTPNAWRTLAVGRFSSAPRRSIVMAVSKFRLDGPVEGSIVIHDAGDPRRRVPPAVHRATRLDFLEQTTTTTSVLGMMADRCGPERPFALLIDRTAGINAAARITWILDGAVEQFSVPRVRAQAWSLRAWTFPKPAPPTPPGGCTGPVARTTR